MIEEAAKIFVYGILLIGSVIGVVVCGIVVVIGLFMECVIKKDVSEKGGQSHDD